MIMNGLSAAATPNGIRINDIRKFKESTEFKEGLYSISCTQENIDYIFNSGEAPIRYEIDGEYYNFNFAHKGNATMTEEQARYFSEKYDFTNMTQKDYVQFYSELSEMDIISGMSAIAAVFSAQHRPHGLPDPHESFACIDDYVEYYVQKYQDTINHYKNRVDKNNLDAFAVLTSAMQGQSKMVDIFTAIQKAYNAVNRPNS
jgi:hypothetical protein